MMDLEKCGLIVTILSLWKKQYIFWVAVQEQAVPFFATSLLKIPDFIQHIPVVV